MAPDVLKAVYRFRDAKIAYKLRLAARKIVGAGRNDGGTRNMRRLAEQAERELFAVLQRTASGPQPRIWITSRATGRARRSEVETTTRSVVPHGKEVRMKQ